MSSDSATVLPSTITVLYATDDNYCLPLAVSLESLCRNNRETNLDIRVALDGVTEVNQARLQAVVEPFGRRLVFVDMPSLDDLLGEPVDVKRYAATTFARIFADQLLPDTCHRVIYIDCDTLVEGNLADMWAEDLGGRPLGAVRDSRGPAYPRALGIRPGYLYIQAGVLLMDLDVYRARGCREVMLDALRTGNGLLEFPDSDLLCSTMQDQFTYLPLRYNVTSLYYCCGYDEIQSLRHPEWRYPADEVADAVAHPVIVHFDAFFLMEGRPWLSSCDHPLTARYREYLRATPWADTTLPETGGGFRRRIVDAVPRSALVLGSGLVHAYLKPWAKRWRLAPYRWLVGGL